MINLKMTRIALCLSATLMLGAEAAFAQDDRNQGNNQGNNQQNNNWGNNQGQGNQGMGNQGQGNQGQGFGGRGGRRQRGFGNDGGGGGGGGSGFGSRMSQRMPNSGNFDQDYGFLADRNIFLRERGQRNNQVQEQGPAPVPLTEQQSYVLIGIIQEGGDYHAHVENVSTGQVRRLSRGEAIASGKITDITIDAAAYEHEGKTTWVAVGANLTGTQVLSVSGARISSMLGRTASGEFAGRGEGRRGNDDNGGRNGGNATPVVAPPPLPGDASLSVEERLRLRRQQEALPAAVRIPDAVLIPPTPPAPVAEQPQPTNLPGAESGLSIEERMRLRRAGETGAGR